MRRSLIRRLAGAMFALGLAALSVSVASGHAGTVRGVLMHPTVSGYTQVTTSQTPPTQAQCNSVGRRCFGPQELEASYNVTPLINAGSDGRGVTVAIVDSYGSDTMAHDLHVYDQAFGLQPMCGEEDVTCAPGMPTFSEFHFQGAPATKPQPGNGTHQEDKSAWAIEVALDVETVHAMAPMANILLVTTPTAETLGVQGFPDMMNAEQYVIDHHMATVISQSFAAGEDSFASAQSLLNLRHAYISAAADGVTVLGSSGDSGSATSDKTPVGQGGSLNPNPGVEWPASDPLVTGVGGTNLCTDATNTTSRVPDSTSPPAICQTNPTQTEIAWVGSGGGYSHVFGTPSYQNTLPAGSTSIGDMRAVPDIAAVAAPGTGMLTYLSLPPAGNSGLRCGSTPCSTGWYVVGGTSLACPGWAGMVAIADQIHGGGLGPINPTLYSLAANPSSYANDFFDVTTGNNTAVSGIPGYNASTGWDPVTGLGTPNAANLLPALAGA